MSTCGVAPELDSGNVVALIRQAAEMPRCFITLTRIDGGHETRFQGAATWGEIGQWSFRIANCADPIDAIAGAIRQALQCPEMNPSPATAVPSDLADLFG